MKHRQPPLAAALMYQGYNAASKNLLILPSEMG
jgi:hypothetical protein